MLSIIFLVMVLIYVAAIFFIVHTIVRNSNGQADQEVLALQKNYEQLLMDKSRLGTSLQNLEQEAVKIFTLYKITHEITKHFNEEAAFDVFKVHLRDNISFSECRLCDPLSEELPNLKNSSDHFLVELKGERRLLGFLALKDVAANDREKVLILANQFALALRRLRLYQQIERLAITDSLTDVYTRRYIMNRFEEEISRSRIRKIQLSFLMIDVDHFKRINDQYGHLTGDQILREVAALIKEHVRGIDIMGRYGGEEFAVVLPDTDQGGAQYVAERIRLAVEKTPLKAYDNVINSTISIGSSTFPQDGDSISELIDKADLALYQAKKLGRNRICAFGNYPSDEKK